MKYAKIAFVLSYFRAFVSSCFCIPHLAPRAYLSVFCLLLSAFCFSPLHAQTNFGSRGTEFWLVFGYNTTECNLQIRVVGGEEETKGQFYYPAMGIPVNFTVPAGQAYTHFLSTMEKGSVSIGGAGISNHSVRITTDKPVMAYVLNQSSLTTGATYLLPTPALGEEYYHISYGPPPVHFYDHLIDAYSVIATQDNTQVHHNKILVATLNTGEVYTRATTSVPNENDLTGSHITANKPIALFNVCPGGGIPNGYQAIDRVFEQIAPVRAWGKKFFFPGTHTGVDRVRIVASQDSTNIMTLQTATIISGTGGQPDGKNLRAGQFIEIEVREKQGGCYIEADKPVGVSAFLVGAWYLVEKAPGNVPVEYSDPGQAWVPPLEQDVTAALLAPFIAKKSPFEHYAIIITPTDTRMNTRVKIGNNSEQPVTTSWRRNDASGMSFYNMRLTEEQDSYLFTNPAGLVVMGYGIAATESYFYLLSSAARIIDALFYVNDIHFQEIPDLFCEQPLHFRAEINGRINNTSAGYIKWYINNVEQKDLENKLTWEKFFESGSFQIKMEVRMDNGEIKVRETTITIEKPELTQPKNLTFCAGDTTGVISFTGIDIDACNWTAPNGTRIGLPAEKGTGNIPSFIAVNERDFSDSVSVTVTPVSPRGCIGEPKTFTVTVISIPLLDIVQDISLCAGDTTPVISFTGANISTVTWVADGGTAIGLPSESGTGNIPSFTTSNNGEEPLLVTITVMPESSGDCTGQLRTFTITVYATNTVHVDLGKDTAICWMDSLRLNDGHPASNITSYRWQDESTGATYTVYQEGGEYWLIVKGACNSQDGDTINISYLTDIVINLGQDTTYCNTDVIHIELDVTNPNASYLWQDGSTSPLFIIEEAGTYSVEVSNACMSVTKEVVIKEMGCTVEINIPNIFTPNGDGLNDLFGVEFIPVENVKEFQMYIYNRWGRLVFSTENCETLWDGNNGKGAPCPAGIYYSAIRFIDILGKEYQYHISLTLLR